MTEIERILNDAMALPNINNGNPLRHNDYLCCHQMVILLEVVNDAAPCSVSSFVNNSVKNENDGFVLRLEKITGQALML